MCSKRDRDQKLALSLKREELEMVKNIIWKHLDRKKYSAFVFGSRATGRHKRWSDIDVGIEGREPLDWGVWQEIEDELVDSDLPYAVDVVDFSLVSKEFNNKARENRVAI